MNGNQAKEMTDVFDRLIEKTTMSNIIIHPPHGSFLMFAVGTSRDGVQS